MFYKKLARYYDLIFHYDKSKAMFMDAEFKKRSARCLLDLACGTGTYTVALAACGYETWGLDLEPGMIRQAEQKAKNAGVVAHFMIGDMRYPEQTGKIYDGAFCIGNSLPHLASEGEVAAMLLSLRRVLSGNGLAIVQIVNFDRILDLGDTALPLIERQGLRFTRIYRPRGEKLIFDAFLEVEENGVLNKYENSNVLLPLRKSVLEKYLYEAGFCRIRVYSDFNYGEFTPESPALVLVAEC